MPDPVIPPMQLLPGLPLNGVNVHRIARHDDGRFAAEYRDDTPGGVTYTLLVDGEEVGTADGLMAVVAWLLGRSRGGEVFDVELLGEVRL